MYVCGKKIMHQSAFRFKINTVSQMPCKMKFHLYSPGKNEANIVLHVNSTSKQDINYCQIYAAILKLFLVYL